MTCWPALARRRGQLSDGLQAHAPNRIINIYIESFRQFGEAQAEAYAQKLTETFERLAKFPRLARERVELPPPVRIHPCGPHVIVYLEMALGNVLIVRIRHGREDWVNDPTGGG